MARPPHKLERKKPLEGVGGLRILNDVGVEVHKLKGPKLHAKLLRADNVRGVVAPSIFRPEASTVGANAPSRFGTKMWSVVCMR